MADVSVLEHIVEKSVLQNNINYDDTTLICDLLDLFNVSGELEVILDGNEENPNVTNRDTPNFSIRSHYDRESTGPQ